MATKFECVHIILTTIFIPLQSKFDGEILVMGGVFSVEFRLNGDGRVMSAFRHLNMYTVGRRRLGSHTVTLKHSKTLPILLSEE